MVRAVAAIRQEKNGCSGQQTWHILDTGLKAKDCESSSCYGFIRKRHAICHSPTKKWLQSNVPIPSIHWLKTLLPTQGRHNSCRDITPWALKSSLSSVNMQKVKNEIGYNYVTIKITRSRINKGLLAIPVSLLDKFPKEKQKITIFFDDEENPSFKGFTPYNSSSQECRISGLTNWFVKNKIQNQDEIVIQFLDENQRIYRIIKESNFIEQINILEDRISKIEKETDLEKYFESLSLKVNKPKKEIAIVEFLKLNNEIMKRRNYKKSNTFQVKENVPFSLRKI